MVKKNIANSTRQDIVNSKKSAEKGMHLKYAKVSITVQKKIALRDIQSFEKTSPSMGNVFTMTSVLTNILSIVMI